MRRRLVLCSLPSSIPFCLSAVSLVAIGASGCSLAFMSAPPGQVSEPHRESIDCTTSWALPVYDAANAVGNLVIAAVFASQPAAGCGGGGFYSPCFQDLHAQLVAVSGVAALAYGISAVYGFRWSSRCARMKQESRACQAGDGESCEALSPGWLPPGPDEPGTQWRPRLEGCASSADCKRPRRCRSGKCVDSEVSPPRPAPQARPLDACAAAEGKGQTVFGETCFLTEDCECGLTCQQGRCLGTSLKR